MSVDVFGRKLKGGKASSHRGPPGIGFKLTSEGHFDLENKRLVNLAPPLQPTDAINLKTAKDLIQSEINSMSAIIARLRSDLDTVNTIVNAELPNLKSRYIVIDESSNNELDGNSGGGASQTGET